MQRTVYIIAILISGKPFGRLASVSPDVDRRLHQQQSPDVKAAPEKDAVCVQESIAFVFLL
jgi:hypothetical protein